jgi:hypothetical protein
MSVKHLWGFGGVKLTCGGYTAEFTNATGTMRFQPEEIVNTTLNGKIVKSFLGYRVLASMEAHNICATDYVQFQNLVDVLNAHFYGGTDIVVYPYYSTTDDNLSYNMQCTSDINPEQIARVKAGQKISLSFQSTERVEWLPILTSDPIYRYWLTQAGANIVTQSGDKIIFKTRT